MNIDDDDEFAEAEPRPACRSPRRNAVEVDTDIDEFADDEFPDEPAPVKAVDEFLDEPDGDQNLLFPAGWEKQNDVNLLRNSSELMPGQLADGSYEAGDITQEILEEYVAISRRITNLNFDKSELRSRILRSLEAGYGVESGLMELKHYKRNVKSKSYDAITSVLGEEATDHLLANLPTFERDVITVRESTPGRTKGAK